MPPYPNNVTRAHRTTIPNDPPPPSPSWYQVTPVQLAQRYLKALGGEQVRTIFQGGCMRWI